MSIRKQKLINDPQHILQEMLEGFAAAHPDIVRLTENNLIVRRTPKAPGKVGIVMGDGSGHEPAMKGWVGYGLLDVDVPGEIFAAPGPEKLVEALRLANQGAGALLVVSHHAGDRMNAEIAMELCAAEGIDNVDMVLLYDDIASAPKGREPERRGTTGLFFVWKLVGAAAESGMSLAECKAVAERVRDNTRALSMALTSAAHPVSGEVMFELPEGEMEVGMGLHGEIGMLRSKVLTADETIDFMLPRILDDLPYTSGDEVMVILNNTGSLTYMELYILFRRVAQKLEAAGIKIFKTWLGTYATTQEMAGFGLGLCRVDDQIKMLWDTPANGAFFKWIPI